MMNLSEKPFASKRFFYSDYKFPPPPPPLKALLKTPYEDVLAQGS